ncbi:MAG: family 20 glycosylhydrolase [Planctomycetota bacterium]|nr:family 20 glycosylhydrolase [Planctomycetota bacterium]
MTILGGLGVLAVVLACVQNAAAQTAAKPPAMVPMPTDVRMATGQLTLGESIVATDAKLLPLANVLAGEIEKVTGHALKAAVGQARAGAIVLKLDAALKGEQYRLDTAGEAAVVAGGNYFAVASGTVTLLQALAGGEKLTVPCMTVDDSPAYAYRGALIDLGRKYHSIGGIKQVVELCRQYKIRYLQVHLSDDQLFMFPSKAFGKAGKSNREFARFEPASAPKIVPYTLEELKDLERFSQERGVHVVPEIDLPGHSGRLIADEPAAFRAPNNGSTINIARDRVVANAITLLNEVMDVFQGTPYVHLGADEVGLGGIDQAPEYAETCKKYGVSSVHDLYCKFIVNMHDAVAKRGKSCVVWEEAWNAGGKFPLPKDVVVMVWCQGRSPEEITKAGYAVINATWTPLYIVRDNRKTLSFLGQWSVPQFGREGSETYTTLADVTNHRGAQLCSWEDSESIEIQSMRDRLALVGEKTWNPKAGSFEGFKERLAHTDAVLEKLVHPVHVKVDGAFTRDENTYEQPLKITLTSERKDLAIRYALDNSMPNPNWKAYTGPFMLTETAHLRAGLFDKEGKQQGYLVGQWFKRVVVVKPNLATGKPVSVGPGPDRTDGWGAATAVDGRADNVDAHWASSEPAPQWLRIDLQKVFPIDRVNVMTFVDGNRYYQLTAEVSVDGKDWKKVGDLSGNTAPATQAGYDMKFAKTDARYVKINMLKNSANPYVHVVEVVVQEAK